MDIGLTLSPFSHLVDIPTRRAAAEAFGISDAHLAEAFRRGTELKICCTTVQFGEFIAKRVSFGCTNNRIRDLLVQIICDPRPCSPAPVFQTKFDVRF